MIDGIKANAGVFNFENAGNNCALLGLAEPFGQGGQNIWRWLAAEVNVNTVIQVAKQILDDDFDILQCWLNQV